MLKSRQDLRKQTFFWLAKQPLRPMYFSETDFLSVDAFQSSVDVFSVHVRNLGSSVLLLQEQMFFIRDKNCDKF